MRNFIDEVPKAESADAVWVAKLGLEKKSSYAQTCEIEVKHMKANESSKRA